MQNLQKEGEGHRKGVRPLKGEKERETEKEKEGERERKRA